MLDWLCFLGRQFVINRYNAFLCRTADKHGCRTPFCSSGTFYRLGATLLIQSEETSAFCFSKLTEVLILIFSHDFFFQKLTTYTILVAIFEKKYYLYFWQRIKVLGEQQTLAAATTPSLHLECNLRTMRMSIGKCDGGNANNGSRHFRCFIPSFSS
jgi:hypothetical protein